MKNYFITGGVILALILGGFGALKSGTSPGNPLGSVASPDIISPYISVGGVRQWYGHQTFNTASTTICSLISPAATSTLDMSSGVTITTGTSTAIALEIGKSSLMDATTTRISYVTLASGAQVTLNSFVASTTGAYGSLGQKHTADETDLIFAPSTRFNVKFGASAIGPALAGTCDAKWIEHQSR